MVQLTTSLATVLISAAALSASSVSALPAGNQRVDVQAEVLKLPVSTTREGSALTPEQCTETFRGSSPKPRHWKETWSS